MKQEPNFSMYPRAPVVGAVLLAVLVLVSSPSWMPSAMAQSAKWVTATHIAYNAISWNWDLDFVHVSCAPLDGDKPLQWRSRYPWTAFCGPEGPRGDAACGLCVQVTNALTGASSTVRIVDECGHNNDSEAMGLDTPAFNQIDSDGRGKGPGVLEVNYQFVDCQD